MKYFDDLGKIVHDEYRRASFDTRAFSTIATRALERLPPIDHVSYAEVIDALVFGESLPAQRQASGNFGQPSIIVFQTPHFQIEVLCWMDSTTEIHQHAFSGAFHVLEGSSVHSVYDFETARRINSNLVLGTLTNRRCELLQRGDIRPIIAGSAFIHALFHLDEPSITVVVRTRGEPDQLPQYSYQGGLAAVSLESADDRVTPRTVTLVRMLAQTAPKECLRLCHRVVAESDLGTAYYVLEQLFRTPIESPGQLADAEIEEVFAAARARWGADIDVFVGSYHKLARANDLSMRRRAIRSPDLRFFLALLMNAPNRARIFDLASARTELEPVEAIRRWLRELTIVRSESHIELLEVELDLEEPLAGVTLVDLFHTVLGSMLDGARGDQLAPRVDRDLPSIAVERVRPVLPFLEAQIEASSLAPLFREAP